MELPKFLIADNSEYPENVYVVHTHQPKFILDVDSENLVMIDGSDVDEELMQGLIDQALGFYEAEIDSYEDEEDED